MPVSVIAAVNVNTAANAAPSLVPIFILPFLMLQLPKAGALQCAAGDSCRLPPRRRRACPAKRESSRVIS
jgi:hypothetical protein